MPTLHWFFSLGVAGRPAQYRLTEPLAARLVRFFPTPAQPNDAGQRINGAFNATSGLLALLGPAAAGWQVQLHMLSTTANRGAPLAELREDIRTMGGWVRQEVVFYDAPARGPAQIDALLAQILSMQASEGDAVYFEATGGFRPFQMAMTLGAELLLIHRPELRLAGTGYAELATERDEVLGELSPVYDFTDLLMTPRWAAAAGALSGRLDARPLAALLKNMPEEPKDGRSRGPPPIPSI
jgi:hypothetical protein